MNTYVYELDGNLYLNLTNRCTNACDFCVRQHDTYKSYPLWLDREPEYEDFLPLLKNLEKYREIVFCGYGEPLFRYELILKLGAYLKSKGCTTRINTNGQGDLINGFPTAPGLAKVIDKINVSLNCPDAKSYQEVCHCEYGEEGFIAMVKFAHACQDAGIDTVFSIVDSIPPAQIEASKAFAAKEGLPLYIRAYIDEE